MWNLPIWVNPSKACWCDGKLLFVDYSDRLNFRSVGPNLSQQFAFTEPSVCQCTLFVYVFWPVSICPWIVENDSQRWSTILSRIDDNNLSLINYSQELLIELSYIASVPFVSFHAANVHFSLNSRHHQRDPTNLGWMYIFGWEKQSSKDLSAGEGIEVWVNTRILGNRNDLV